MARYLRGDLVWADLNPTVGHEQGGRRPVLIVSADAFNMRSGTVIALAVTTQPQRAEYPLTLEIDPSITSTRSWIKTTQVRTLSTARLGKRLGTLPATEVDKAVEGLYELIGR